MSIAVIQQISLVLPQGWVTGLETEDMNDLVVHVSREFYCADIQEKHAQIVAIENIAAGAPGNLWFWVELSPVLSTTSTAYWAAIGGGGGALAPVAPTIIVPAVVDGTTHTEVIAWNMHSANARIVVQMPVAATPLTAFWQVQVIFSGKN